MKTFHTSFSKISDHQLFTLCQKYGEQARHWRQKFSGLLPEVFRRKLYEKKGFGSIFEFAAKLAGMSQDQVRRILGLERKLEDKPILKNMLENGEVSINKLLRITKIATNENEEFWAEQIKLLPQKALETLVRDEKEINESVRAHVQNNTENQKMQLDSKFLELILQFPQELKQKLLILHEKNLDVGEILIQLLQRRELEISQEKEQIAAEVLQKSIKNISEVRPQPTKSSRYISVKIKKILKKEYGTKCSIHTCKKSSVNIHHTQRFALSQNHDPRFLAPLCHEHHVIVHSIDQKFHQKRKLAIHKSPNICYDPM